MGRVMVSGAKNACLPMLAAALTGGDITVRGAQTECLGAFLDKLEEAGISVENAGGDALRVRAREKFPQKLLAIPERHRQFPHRPFF